MLNIIRKGLLPVLLFLVMGACEKEASRSESLNENYEPVDVRVAMTVAGYQNQGQTRGSRTTTLSGDMGNEENTIHNITVFQFNGEGDDTDPLVVLRYVDSSLDNLLLGLMQPKSDPNKEQFIYFVANTGNLLQNFSGTYGDLKQELISVNEGGIADGIMVMTCSLKTKITTLQGITINFIRRLAKVNVTCSVAAGINFTPARLQLRNVPKSFVLEKTSAILPEASTENFLNYLSLTENITNGYTWYMPENMRGTGSAADAKNKTASTASAGQGDYCTYVELSGLYQDNGTSKLVSYKIYLGANNTTDYNVEANQVYNVNISVVGVDGADGRLTIETLPASKAPANCYMVVPGTAVVIDLLKSPGTPVSSSGIDYATRVGSGTTNTNHIKSIGVLWQTEDTPDGLIQDLTYFDATGQAMFKATPQAAGNLLLAAYSEPDQRGTILWSWHIWVTDYQPENYQSGNTTVPGGNVYNTSRDGGTWMDRDLGALTATPGVTTTIGYAYQWGRKDPFPLSDGLNSLILRPLYDFQGNYLRSGAATEVHNSDEKDLIEKAIASPWIFFSTTEGTSDMTTGYWWKTSEELALWSDTDKTMYDPCPAGWRIPSSTIVGKLSGASISLDGTKYGGYYSGSLWYQYCGYMSYMDGSIGEPGSTSVYWSSKLYKMYQNTPKSIGSQLRHGGFGFIGRCVKE